MRFHLRNLTVLAALASWSGCGGNPPDKGDDAPYVTITGSYGVKGDPNRTFNFNTDLDKNPSGGFTGNENIDNPVQSFTLTGVWSGGSIEMVVNEAPPLFYRATYATDNPTAFDFVSSVETITLMRQ